MKGDREAMYKMISYCREDGQKHTEQRSNNPAYFDRYKGKTNYFIEIYQKSGNRWKLIFSER